MISKHLIWISCVLLVTCGGGGSPNIPYPVNQEENSTLFEIFVVDGPLRNASVTFAEHESLTCTPQGFNETYQDTRFFTSDDSARIKFSTDKNWFLIKSLGGIDVITGNTLENLSLYNSDIDKMRFLPDGTPNFGSTAYVTPVTTAEYFFGLDSSICVTNRKNLSINKVFYINENINVNEVDHSNRANYNGRQEIKHLYKISNQLVVLVESLTRLKNFYKGSSDNTDDVFKDLIKILKENLDNNGYGLSLESNSLINQLVDKTATKNALPISSDNLQKVKNSFSVLLPLIQIKQDDLGVGNLEAANAIIDFATSTFFSDLLDISGNDPGNKYDKYSNSLTQYISQVTGISESKLLFEYSANDDSIILDEDTSFEVYILGNDNYLVNDSLNISFTNPSNGTLTLNPSNTLTYSPNTNFYGTDSFSYTIQQGSNSSSANVNIQVNGVNDAPKINGLSSLISVVEGVTFIANVSATDPEGEAILFSVSGADSNYVQISSSGQLTFKNSPNFESKNNFIFSIIASDGNSQTSQNLTVQILNSSNQVDLLIYYAPDMLTEYLSESAIETKMQYQVTSLNNALARSEADLSFNLIKLMPYDIDISNQTPEQILNTSAGRAKIKQDQILYGADYHVIISRWNAIKGGTQGLASIDLSIDETDWDLSAGILSNWTADSNWQELDCEQPCVTDKVFSHELGHNLGSGHWPGEAGQSYAFGHRVDGDLDGLYQGPNDWGTIMSYSDISPDYFSNPEVDCKVGEPCGVLNLSDNTRWYDSYATRFSDILPATYLNNSNSGKKINVKDFFPKINGGSSVYSNGGMQRTFSITSLGTTSISGNPYETFKWENSVSGNSQMAFHFYERNGVYYLKRSDYESGYYFSGNAVEYTLYDQNNLCTFMEAYKTIGNYLSRTCKNAYEGDPPIYNDTYHFTNFIKEETLTVPYGTYQTKKFVLAIFDNSKGPGLYPPYLMHVVFWLNNEVGIVQYRDHLGRIWKLESADSDGDGQDNKTDNDDDNDGILDINDAFKLDPSSSVDSNSDGIPD